MIHILLLILKIIGFILAAILGILVLLICIVLFVPIRYELAVKCDGTIESLKAKMTVTWLLKLLSAEVLYKDKKVRNRIRIAWIKKEVKSNEKETHEEVRKAMGETAEEIEKITTVEETEKACKEQRSEASTKETESIHKNISEDNAEDSENNAKNDEEKQASDSKKSKRIKKRSSDKKHGTEEDSPDISEKIKDFVTKKDKLVEFIQDENHVEAFWKIKKELFFLLNKWRPRKAKIKVIYGFDDPCTTGQVLAGLSVIYPFLGDDLIVEPDFERQIFKGSIYLKGKIRCSHLAASAIRLLISRNVRRSYKDIKNFKL